MAHLVEINAARSESERAAQIFLAKYLPDSWIITTNIKERNFSGRRKPEIDSVVVSPLGIFIIDFKNFRGSVTPMTNHVWTGLEENLFDQADDNVFPVKDLIERRTGETVWVNSLIVFTHKDGELNWQTSDVVADQRLRVAKIGDVEARIRDIASRRGNRNNLNSYIARKSLEALKPVDIPEQAFQHEDWQKLSAEFKSATNAPPPKLVKPVAPTFTSTIPNLGRAPQPDQTAYISPVPIRRAAQAHLSQ
ncbi:hypothetical protein ABIB99_008891 [Bradyrhizobium sp. LA6.1]|uniref:nuclease-related domain-containing protein n=1 Tax=Bradyrhizobium sp. LA6.1 TaxID=3156378 RepID=UPI0033932FE7